MPKAASKKVGSPIYGAAWTEKGIVLAGGGGSASCGIKNKVIVTDFVGGELMDAMITHETKEDMPTKISAHESTVAVLYSKDCVIYTFDVEKKSISVAKTVKDIGESKSVAFSPCGSMLAIGGEDGHLRVYTYPALVCFGDVKDAHSDAITDICFAPDSRCLCSVSSAKAGPSAGAIIWNIWSEEDEKYKKTAAGKCLEKLGYVWDAKAFKELNGNFRGVAYSSEGNILYLGFNHRCSKTRDIIAYVCTVQPSTLLGLRHTQLYKGAALISLAISSCGKTIVSNNSEGGLVVLQGHTLQRKGSMPKAHLVFATSAACSPCGTRVLSASADSSVLVLPVSADASSHNTYLFLLCFLFLLIAIFTHAFLQLQ